NVHEAFARLDVNPAMIIAEYTDSASAGLLCENIATQEQQNFSTGHVSPGVFAAGIKEFAHRKFMLGEAAATKLKTGEAFFHEAIERKVDETRRQVAEDAKPLAAGVKKFNKNLEALRRFSTFSGAVILNDFTERPEEYNHKLRLLAAAITQRQG